MARRDIIIGIDPDCKESGVAVLSMRDMALILHSYTFPEQMDYLRTLSSETEGLTMLVVVEASWMTSANWHGRFGDSVRVGSRKGYDVGRNHETGRKIVEMCRDYLGIPVKCRHPLRKCWRGRDGKITHPEMVSLLSGSGVGCGRKTSNQEERDAALLALDESGIPLKIKHD